MATSFPTKDPIPLLVHINSRSEARAASTVRRRRVPYQSGRALEMLSHAIDYLTDEFALECMTERTIDSVSPRIGVHPRIAAIEILKQRNREIYLSFPEVPTLAERLRACLGMHTVQHRTGG